MPKEKQMKAIIIAVHMLSVVAFCFLFRNFPFDPIPNWQKYLVDLWMMIGVFGSIGLLLQKRWGKLLSTIFYLRLLFEEIFIFIQLLKMNSFASEFGLSFFIERCLKIAIFCFPLVLLYGLKISPPQQVTAAEGAE